MQRGDGMSMVEVAQATVTIIPNMKGSQNKITKELNRVNTAAVGSKMSKSLGSTLISGVRSHAKAIGGILAGVGVAKFASKCVDSFTSLAGSTKSLQRIIGGTSEQVSGLMGAMKLSGMDVDKASTSLTIFSKKLESVRGDEEKAADMSKALGTSFLDANGNIRPMSEMLPEIADKFAKMDEGAEKTALACQLFGKSGTAMLPFLNKGSAGVDELTAKAKDLGIVLDDNATAKFAAYRGAVREWETALQGAQVTLGQSFTPFITAAATVLTDTVVPGIQAASKTVSSFLDGFTGAFSNGELATAFEGIGNAFSSAFGSENTDVATGFGQAIGNAINGLVPILQGATPIAEAVGGAFKFVSDNAETVVPVIGLVVGAFIALKAVSGIVGPLQGIMSSIGGIASKAPMAATGTGALATAETAQGAAAAGSAGQTLALGAAILMIGGGVLLAGAGLYVMAQAAIALAGAGAGAVGVMVGMGAALVVLGAALVVAGPALGTAAFGALAFGAAVMMIGIGIGVASIGLSMVAAQLPVVAAFGIQAGAAALILGAGLLVMGAGALVAGAGCVVLGAGLLVCAPGLILCSAAAIALGAAMVLIGIGSIMAGAGFAMMSASLPTVASSAGAAAAGLGALVIPLGLIAVPAAAAGAGLLACGTGIALVGSMALIAGAGLALMAAFLPLVAATAPTAAETIGALAIACTAASGSIAAAALPMGVLAATAGASAATILACVGAMLAWGAAAGGAMTAAGMAAIAAMRAATSAVKKAAHDIAATKLVAIVEFELGKLPHFSMRGKFDAKARTVPTIDVNWYARGGIFDGPSVIGVGEAGTEVVAPMDKLLGYIRDAISEDRPEKTINNIFNGVQIEDGTRMAQLMQEVADEANLRNRADER